MDALILLYPGVPFFGSGLKVAPFFMKPFFCAASINVIFLGGDGIFALFCFVYVNILYGWSCQYVN